MTLPSQHNDPCFAQDDHPFYQRADRLVVTRNLQIVDELSCERILLPRAARWPSHHVHGHVGRQSGGRLVALMGGGASMLWTSDDGGVHWDGQPLDIDDAAGLVVLDDDSLLMACGGGEEPIRILQSQTGERWTQIGGIEAGLFDALHIDSQLLQLRDGTVLLAVNLRLNPPPGAGLLAGQYPQYLLRSADRGATWTSYGAPEFWGAVKAGSAQVEDDGPHYVWPGEGGTFPGVYETGFLQRRDGGMLGAFRFSGPPREWHRQVIADWGEPPSAPDDHGRLFRHIVLGESDDEGLHWQRLRPVLSAAGQPLMAHGESNGELVELSDGRLVLIHQTRYAEAFDQEKGYFRGRSTLSARVSEDGGDTWNPERYRLLFGFGYSHTLALEDDTLVTVTGCCLGDNGDPRRAAVIRWRL